MDTISRTAPYKNCSRRHTYVLQQVAPIRPNIHYRFLSCSKRLARASNSFSSSLFFFGGSADGGFRVLAFSLRTSASSSTWTSGSLGVRTPALLASADIDAASSGCGDAGLPCAVFSSATSFCVYAKRERAAERRSQSQSGQRSDHVTEQTPTDLGPSFGPIVWLCIAVNLVRLRGRPVDSIAFRDLYEIRIDESRGRRCDVEFSSHLAHRRERHHYRRRHVMRRPQRTRSLTQLSRFSITASENSRPYLCMRMSRSICNSEIIVRLRLDENEHDARAGPPLISVLGAAYMTAHTPSITPGSGSRVLQQAEAGNGCAEAKRRYKFTYFWSRSPNRAIRSSQ